MFSKNSAMCWSGLVLLTTGWLTDHGGPLMVVGTVLFIASAAVAFKHDRSRKTGFVN